MATMLFTDTDGVTPAQFGDSVARVRDCNLDQRPGIQASTALRPRVGRAPVAGRRNLLEHTENLAHPWWYRRDGIVASHVEGAVWRLTASAGDNIVPHFGRSNQIEPMGADRIASVEVRPVTHSRVQLSMGGSPNSGGGAANHVIFELSGAGSVIDGGLSTSHIAALEDGWFRIATSGSGNTSSSRNRFNLALVASDADTREEVLWSPTGTEVIEVRFPQYEHVSTLDIDLLTPYQRVGEYGFDITEPVLKLPSPGFLRFDLSDDRIDHTFPGGFEGDVMVFGRNGSWLEKGMTIAPGQQLEIGPRRAVNAAPLGSLDVLGDIVGWLPIGRETTPQEQQYMVDYYKERGAKGLLVPGPELITNGGPEFASALGWEPLDSRSDLSIVDGKVRATLNTAGEFHGLTYELSEADLSGRPVIIDMEFSWSTATVRTLDLLGPFNLDEPPPSSFPRIGTANASNRLRLRSNNKASQNLGNFTQVHYASLRELRPQEDW